MSDGLARTGAQGKEEGKKSEIVLSPEQDSFYQANMYQNFGDLGERIRGTAVHERARAARFLSRGRAKLNVRGCVPAADERARAAWTTPEYVNEYQRKANTSKKIESVDDMKRFVQEFPEFRRMAGNVSKHVMLVSHLSHVVDDQCLLDVSEIEQELAVLEDHGNAIQACEWRASRPGRAAAACDCGRANNGAGPEAAQSDVGWVRHTRVSTASWTTPRYRSTTRSAWLCCTRSATSATRVTRLPASSTSFRRWACAATSSRYVAAEEACRARAVRRSRPRDAPHRWRAPAHQLVASLNRYAGAAQRQGDLFLNENMLSRSKAVLKKGLKVRVRNTSSTRARSFLMRPCP